MGVLFNVTRVRANEWERTWWLSEFAFEIMPLNWWLYTNELLTMRLDNTRMIRTTSGVTSLQMRMGDVVSEIERLHNRYLASVRLGWFQIQLANNSYFLNAPELGRQSSPDELTSCVWGRLLVVSVKQIPSQETTWNRFLFACDYFSLFSILHPLNIRFLPLPRRGQVSHNGNQLHTRNR